MKVKFLEEDMYPYIKKYFEEKGFKVNGEVNDCDITAVKDGIIVIIELKKNLTVELLTQAVKRQKIGDLAYIAVPRPERFSVNSKFKDTLYLLKRLSLGLIFTDMEKGKAEVIQEPVEMDLKRSKRASSKKRDKLIKEINGRATSLNNGGTTGKKLMTSYREDAIKMLYLADINEFITPKMCVSKGIVKAQSIVRDNYYGWFERSERGRYVLTDEGKKALEGYSEILSDIIAGIKENNEE